MARSGIAIDDEVKKVHKMIDSHKICGARFVFNSNNTRVVVEENSIIPLSEKQPFEKLMEGFTDDQAKFGLLDLKFKNTEDSDKNPVVFITWASDNCVTKQKMLVASTSASMMKQFGGECKHVHMDGPEAKCIDKVLTVAAKNYPAVELFSRPVAICKSTREYQYV